MIYYIYHIPGKKVGVTTDLQRRVEQEQGYKEGEYEVIMKSDDISIASELELQLQKTLGYKKDIKPYKELFKTKMKINATEQTSTFPCPIGKLKGNLMDNIGLSWETDHGKFEITEETIPWIMRHVKTSMFNIERCYIYNKAYYEEFINKPKVIEQQTAACPCGFNNKAIFDAIRDWARTRGIYEKGDIKTQYVKLAEEFGELGKAILDKDHMEVVDAIGDMVVVLTNLAHLQGVKIENCIDAAYSVIKQRSGKMINGTFVKDEK